MVISPTWSNDRSGSASIAKRLDRYFMAETLCGLMGKYRSWNNSTGFSDHKSIILQLDFYHGLVPYSFKFNPTWLLEDEFNTLVME